MKLIARGQVTISTVEDGANAVSIFIRSHFVPSTPTGVSPSGWNVNPDAFANSYGILWVSNGLKNSDGTLKGIWSKPTMHEPYNSNLLWNFPWSLGSGSTSIYLQNGSPNYREMYETPFGYKDIVWRGVSDGNNDSDGGFIATNCKIDHTKPYRMSCWFKRTSTNGTSYFGANGASRAVQIYSDGAWIERTNFYFWSGDLPEINKWYLLVGYMYGSGETKTTADSRAGIYDPVTGRKVLSFSIVSRNYPDSKTNGIRVYQYYCSAANIPAYFWSPRVDLLDGREPSIEELLKKSKDGDAGRSVIDTDVEYAQSSYATVAPTSGWQTTAPIWSNGKYIWQRVKTTFSTGSPHYSTAVNITGQKGSTGSTGSTGRGITAIIEQFYLSTSKTTQVGGSWSESKPTWSAGKYVWIRSKITYTTGSPSTTYTTPYCDSSWEVVNDIEIGTVNLLSGASNSLGWSNVENFENNIFYKTLPANATETYFYSAYLPVLTIGAKYLLSFEIKAEGDFNRTEIYILSNKYSTNGAIFNSVINGVTSTYLKVTIPFTPDADFQGLTDVKVRFDIDKTSGTRNGAKLWIKEAMLVKGNIAPQSFLIPPQDIFKASADAQAAADAITKKANDEGWATKLTHIDKNGIFTGQLSANTVTSIRINASQITTGTIDAARINTAALKSTLITASNINALTLDVVRGKIGGWTIASGSMKSSNITLDSSSKRVAVYGASSSATSGHRTQLYYNNNNDFGFFTTNSSGSVVAQFGSANRVAGWNITNSYIYKNSIYLGSDGSIYNNSNKWKLANDGSGRLANGAIAWDAAGKVTFSSTVALNWENAINKGTLYVRGTGLNHTANRIVKLNGTLLVNNTSRGLTLTVLNRNTLALVSTVNYDVYESEINCNSLASELNKLGADKIVILTSYDAIRINSTLNIAIQRCGGNDYTTTNERIPYALIGIPTIGKNRGLVVKFSTNSEEPHAEIATKITDGIPTGISFNGSLYTHISGNGIYTGTLTATQVNSVSISASSIKTGTLSADRIATGSISASKLNATSIKSEIINTNYINGLSCTFTKGSIGGWTINSGSISGNNIILNDTNNRIAVYATGSSSTSGHRVQLYYTNNSSFGFYATNSAGSCIAQLGSSNHISGWQINSGYIKKNSVYLGSDGSIYNGSKWKLANDGSGYIANGNITWNSAGTVTFSSAVSLLWKNDIEAAKSTNFGYRYYKSIVINGDEDKYYPVVIKGGDQTVKRDILIRRSYNEQAPDSWHTSTHHGGLTLLLKTNFGGWGGAQYSWEIYELAETYCRMFAGAILCGNCVMFAIFLRGGGSTGAKYHIYSDQALDSNMYSPSPIPHSPQIAYNSDKIFSTGSYLAYAPAPRTLTESVENEIRTKRFITLAQGNDTTLQQHPLTYIGSTGIYTGTLTANQVNAVAISATSITTGTLSASRIASGSIDATKLNADSIKANIINTSYINGLTCTFTKGTIGGWRIGTDNITAGTIGGDGQMPMQLRTTAYGSGYWYSGSYKPFGISMTWHKSNNAGHLVIGQVAASGNSVKTGFMGIQMMSWDHLEYFCISTNYTCAGSKEIYNRIAGWAFDSNSIWKNSVYLGSDGSIYNSNNRWRFNNDGSGRLANGNITWNSSGTVTFGPSVSLNWTNAANTAASNALNSAKSYADTKKSEAISSAATDATNKANAAKELASAMAYGRMLYRDPTFFNGNNSINVYNNAGGGTVTHSRKYSSTAPNDSKYILEIKTIGGASPESGGFYFGTSCSYRKIYITRIIAKIPSGRSIGFATNSIGTGGSQKWLTPTVGTGDWCEYICKVVCGTSNFSSTHFFYITGYTNVTWYVSYATVFDTTSVEKFTTTIDGNGIYTGTLNANQITAGTIHSSRIDTNSIKAAIVTASNINALTLTTTKGSIGGWNISSSQISKNSVVLSSDGSIVNGTKWRLNNNGSGQLANGNISWDTAGNITARNAKFSNVRIQGSLRNPFVFNDSAIWIGGNSSNQTNFNNYDNIVATNTGSWGVDIPLPWTLENSGRRVTLVNYKWGSTISTGYMDISAPSGKYFYEDGIAKSSIRFSRELIELLGYGDSSTFFGWIVVNRQNLMTKSRYGKNLRVIAQGKVSGYSSSASISYKTFDNTYMSVSRISTGRYKVTFSSSWGVDTNKLVIMLTGVGYSSGSSSAPIKATVNGIYSTYFYVETSDDSSKNDGSFFFQITNMNDWTY